MDNDESLPLLRRLRQEILFARQRVYRAGSPTPLEQLPLPGFDGEIWVKREDVSPIKAYKWRGAFNRMAIMTPEESAAGVVTASAGNHAQGVALAAGKLGVRADIFMPGTTPAVKQNAVKRLGGDMVKIHLVGDAYDEAVQAAQDFASQSKATIIHAYDDLHVMAGQGSLADEVVMSGQGPFDVAFLQIGGGGMAAGVGCWLRMFWPDIKLIGVEGVDQASMKAAIAADKPVRLDNIDIFCDGSAVRQAGDLPFEVCRELLDDIVTVTNQEVSEAIRVMWDGLRAIPEPAGALGLAGALQCKASLAGKRVLTVLCGANLDFSKLALIADNTGSATAPRHFLRINIPEVPGTMLKLLDEVLAGVSIHDFLYGKTDSREAWPIFGINCDATQFDAIKQRLGNGGYQWETAAGEDIEFRAIPCHKALLSHPLFLKLEFYERPGALHDFLSDTIRGRANFCYFNYRYTGERIGRALIGLEFTDEAQRADFLAWLPASGKGYRQCRPVPDQVVSRMI
ncbi:pyridoxal-phosphate dependent enzyme [Cerasicoccus fimbriatus]|uniref:pyridoxal-phosphate dependent enzyme n=1 Tax=Cerasicoccus fimbriatus TaxID=3014554 RepID=UPI0022B48ED1|nr:pyridoxal-phosphate dependent enzyme [Cerasicoccus sp. TK19100]